MASLLRINLRPVWRILVAAGAIHILTAQSVSFSDRQQAFINGYCIGCHSSKLKTGGLVLEGLDIRHVADHADVWEKVLQKVHSGEMPPKGLPRPAPAEYADLGQSLEKSLDSASAASPNPGRPAVHRLNRTEYSNAIRDLLGLDLQAGAKLPADNTSFGFDNIANVLSMSPSLLERYVLVARSVSHLAVGDLKLKPTKDHYEPPRDPAVKRSRNERVGDDLPFDSRGGIDFKRYFPLDGEYLIQIKMRPDPVIVAEEGIERPVIFEMRLPVKAGMHAVGVTFPKDS